jgi:hypothetical protein
MASPATKTDLFLGLSNSEMKLITLGIVCNDSGKVCIYLLLSFLLSSLNSPVTLLSFFMKEACHKNNCPALEPYPLSLPKYSIDSVANNTAPDGLRQDGQEGRLH